MAEPTITTPGSNADSSSTPRGPATKDKRCQYCDQAFTSSSLGRHLDLYIKEKNPKPADGIHNVDEIRKARGGITRRQARSSSGRANSSTPMGSSKRSPEEATPTSPPSKLARMNTPSGEKVHARLNNNLAWQATGVIRDLPVKPQDATGPLTASTTVRHTASSINDGSRNSAEQKHLMKDALDRGRAAELALREVLDSVTAASIRAGPPPTPLDFDPLAFTFPALVLRCLPPPSTLQSTQPFSTPQSWSLDPPGQTQLDALTRYFRTTYSTWIAEHLAAQSRKASSSTTATSENGMVNGFDHPTAAFEEEAERVIHHVTEAFHHHKSLSEKAKTESWRLETLRAFAREQQLHRETKSQLDLARQEIEQLKLQMERLSNCQQPRELTLYPPSSMPISSSAIKHLSASYPSSDGAASGLLADWDYDRLLTKWKGVVLGSRRPTTSAEIVSLPTPVEGVAAAEFTTPNYHHNGFTATNAPASSASKSAAASAPAPTTERTSRYNTADASGEDADADDDHVASPSLSKKQLLQQHKASTAPQAVMMASRPAAGPDAKARVGKSAGPTSGSAAAAQGHAAARDVSPPSEGFLGGGRRGVVGVSGAAEGKKAVEGTAG